MTEQQNENMRKSLSDLSSEDQGFFQKRRDRSASNENYDLPPLPELEDNKDLYQDEDDNYMNYKSNEKATINNLLFAGLAAADDDDKPQEALLAD